MPTLKEKHHAMVGLDYVVASDEDEPFDDDGTPASRARRERLEKARQHPYYYETRHLPYPTSMFIEREPVAPKSFEDTPFEFVDTPEQLAALTKVLLQAKEIAVDLEHHSERSYYGFTCLMQISTREQDWVVDTLALRSELREHKLGGVLADPSIIKVFHGADSDIVWLQRDFDIYVVNLFDTYQAAKTLDFPKKSLQSLLQTYCQFEADKQYQVADWRIRPLPKEMMFYARSDTHFLLYVYDHLRNNLVKRSSRPPSPDSEGGDGASTPKPNPQSGIRLVLALSAETALKLHVREGYSADGYGPMGWQNLAKKFGKADFLKRQPGYIFKRLHRWRDNLARELDESPQ
jgi:exosome complex exonuclease RRP6